jgi:DNA polymerase-1
MEFDNLNTGSEIILIDGANLFHRNYYNFCKYPTTTATAYGFVSSMISYFDNGFINSLKFIVCWEGSKIWRKQEQKEYKNNRDNRFTDAEKKKFDESLKNTKRLLKEIGIIQVVKDELEADDLIGYFTNYYSKDIVIISNDKDFLQFVNDEKNISVLRPDSKTYIRYKEKHVKEKYGVPAKMIPAFLAIAGDSSDNVKGVYKMGEVKAKELINSGQIKKNNLEKVFNREQLKQFIECYKLVKLGSDKYCHIEITQKDYSIGSMLKGDAYFDKILDILDEYDINRLSPAQMNMLNNRVFKSEFAQTFK